MGNTRGNKPERLGGTATVVRPDRGWAAAGRGEEWLGEASTYYNMPLIKKAHWSWEVILYFFFGGMAGGSFLVSTLADLLGSVKDAALMRVGRYTALICILISPVLLVKDLGRPERFHHMLRVLKLRSAMSLGSWAITVFGICCGLITAHQVANDGPLNWFPPLARSLKTLPVKIIEVIGSVFGLFIASYTGVLLSSTAVPVWARARHILGPLFLSSGLSTALASLSLLLSLGRSKQDTLERLSSAEMITMATELGLISTLPRVLGPLARPLFKGKVGVLFMAGTIGGGLIVPLCTRLGWKLMRKPMPRALNIVTSLMVLVGGIILRSTWIAAGRGSADDPQATHYYNAVERKRIASR
jgi:formate-dependent nitrite reductase membrane component NrfD